MKKLLNTFPYFGWVGLIILSLILTTIAYQYEKSNFTPERLAAAVQADFTKRAQKLENAIKSGALEYPIKKELLLSHNNEFSIAFLDSASIDFWSGNNIPSIAFLYDNMDPLLSGKAMRYKDFLFYGKAYRGKNNNSYVVSIIPIAYQYKGNQRFFSSHFVAGKTIPASGVIGNNGLSIKNIDGSTAFHIHFKDNIQNEFKIRIRIGLLALLFVSLLFVWVHKISLAIGRKSKPIYGFIFLSGFALFCIFLKNWLGYPVGFENSGMFSPEILASSDNIRSLPDLAVNIVFGFWASLYFVKYIIQSDNKLSFRNESAKILAPLIGIAITALLYFYIIRNIKILVLDSKLFFMIDNLQDVSFFSFIGMELLILTSFSIVFFSASAVYFFGKTFHDTRLVYLTFVLISIIFIVLIEESGQIIFYINTLFCSVIAIWYTKQKGVPLAGFDYHKLTLRGTHAFSWIFFICLWVVVDAYSLSFYKEREFRKSYAERQENQNDLVFKHSFSSLSKELQKDPLIKAFLKDPSYAAGRGINRHISFHYVAEPFLKYQINLYYYNHNRKPLLNADTQDRILLRIADQQLNKRMEEGLVMIKNESNQSSYWGMVPIYDSIEKANFGYIGFDFSKNINNARQTPITYFQKTNNNRSDEHFLDNYSYAYYKNNKLESQDGSYLFPYYHYSKTKTEGNNNAQFKEYAGYSELIYQPKDKELFIVRYKRNVLLQLSTLFSFISVTLIIFAATVYFMNFLVRSTGVILNKSKRFNLSIRGKLSWTIMITVFLSMIIVSFTTVSFISKRYADSQIQNLRNLMFYYEQTIVNFLETQRNDNTLNQSFRTNQYAPMAYLLNTLAAEQGQEINLYNKKGLLIATSQNLLLQRGYLSQYINPEALNNLGEDENRDWLGVEQMGRLDYQSLYLSLRDKENKIIAYLNLPYYSANDNLQKESSSFLTTLINIYIILFLLAGVVAYLVSRNIVRTFNLLINQFKAIKLEHNVLIQWPYNDELGLIVTEYNNLLLKVEKMATSMANKERESAWQDLALQIAHEIKNPLTPMKLNIQYLKKAINDNNPELPKLINKVSDSLIEQIENLNTIASEFAQFAKMPQSNPEELNVIKQLEAIIPLYTDDNVSIQLNKELDNPKVWMDKSYFIRIFNNFIKNAIQAIPNEHEKMIQIKVTDAGGDRVRIGVKDNGIGIPEKIQKRIFSPYFTTKSSGSGIGLAMSKNMTELSDGQIGFDTKEGKGTEFFIILPLLIKEHQSE